MERNLKVLMLSSDRNVFTPGSQVSKRMAEYAALVEELHIIVLSDKKHRLSEKKLADNLWVYPTDSSFKFFRPIDAAGLGKRLVLKRKFVRGLSLVTADSLEAGWAGMRIKKRWRIPLEIQLHTDPFSPYFSGFQNIVRKIFMGGILRHADSIRVVSECLKLKIENLLKIENSPPAGPGRAGKLKILPIFVNREPFENGQIHFDIRSRYPWRFVILMVCRLEREKNIPLALKILNLIRARYPDAGLLIVGSGSEENNLKALAKKMKLEGAVEFAGWQDDLFSFYKTANVFLQTSYFEGYGLSLVEAGLAELPVVTTPVGLAAELEQGKDAFICPADAPEAFAEAIIELIENNQKRETMSLNLKKTLEGKLISKEEYLKRLKENWENTANRFPQ